MPLATIDCGTTNSRVYLLADDGSIVGRGSLKVGVRDTALHGSNQVLKDGLKELFERTLHEHAISLADIRLAITSGMITSELGLLEIPHLRAPVGIDDLAANVRLVRDRDIFPLEIPLLFIPGIKNRYPADATYRDIRLIDFMRGEETQIVGLLELYPELSLPVTAVILSSHTKYVSIGQDRRILGSLTTLSGQVFEAIRDATSVGKSLQGSSPAELHGTLDTGVIETAFDAVRHAGFLRSLLMPRFMDVLLRAPSSVRRLFIEAAICAEDLKAMEDFPLMGFPGRTAFVLVGSEARCQVFAHLLQANQSPGVPITHISDEERIDRLSIQGAIAIARKAGYLGE